MYMRIRLSLFVALLFSGLLYSQSAFAQDPEEPREETFAHAQKRQWKGIDVNTVLGQDEYATTGKRIFLYNVGTGKFVIEGGNWGMEARLFHEDFGRPMNLKKDGYIESGITEAATATKILFGCNVPQYSKPTGTWAQYTQFSYTVMMDVDKTYCAPWQFQRVETDPNADTYTYYMWENLKKKNSNTYQDFYLGAAWGEWHVPKPEGKGDSTFVYLDADRSCWTTGSVIGNMTEFDVDGDMITVDELYQWRIISEEEFISVLNDEVIGLNPSISSLVPDRDFARNSDNFDTNWVMEEKDGYEYSSTNGIGRRGYTFGIYLNKGQQSKYYSEPWDKPIRLKETFEGSQEYGLANAKYGYLFFEGVGRTHTQFVVPKPGWYQVQCYGFVQSDSDHDAYLYAKVAGSEGTTSYGGESKINLVKVNPGTYTGKNSKDNCLLVGKELTKNGKAYKNTVWICVTEEQFNSGNDLLKTLEVGVGKDLATRSGGEKNGNKWYYYDTDWVCIDDIRVSYMGIGPVFFYEEEEDLDYLAFDETGLHPSEKEYMSATPNGQYSGAACLERTFKKNQWNSFSFPLPLTGEQMRLAFGEDAQLARIHSIGNLSLTPYVIDFKSVSLRPTDFVVEPNQFYLLKPTVDPTFGYDPTGTETYFYELGRMFFSINENESPDYTFPKLSLSHVMDNTQSISSYEGKNDGQASVNYVKTPGFDSFQVNSAGTYTGSVANGVYAPNGAYVVSNNTIYHINKDTRLKGFRGWITLSTPIPQFSDSSMAVFGMFYNEGITEAIELPMVMPVQLSPDTSVYDLSGRKVGTIGMALPKGLYIVNGKKYCVK